MASNQTPNLQLCQWEADDEVLRADFNADNAKIDTAVGELSESLAGVSARYGNCLVVAGTYVGTGVTGEAHPCKLAFPYRPMVVLLDDKFSMRQGVNTAMYSFGTLLPRLSVSWIGDTVNWYIASGDASFQCNNAGQTYHYVAILERVIDSSLKGTFSAT